MFKKTVPVVYSAAVFWDVTQRPPQHIWGWGGGALRDIPKTAAEDTTVPALMVIDRISNFWSVYK